PGVVEYEDKTLTCSADRKRSDTPQRVAGVYGGAPQRQVPEAALPEQQLPELVDVSATRALLHKLAEDVPAAEQFAANHELRLEVVPGGFATGWFPGPGGTDRQIKVVGAELVREWSMAETTEPVDGLDPAAAGALYAW